MLGHPEYLDTHADHVQAVTTHGPLRAHTHTSVCVWCDAGRCGDQWESMLGPLTEAIKREWIMRLFIDWSICNQGILLRRSWELFSFQSALLLSSLLPSLCLYLHYEREKLICLRSIFTPVFAVAKHSFSTRSHSHSLFVPLFHPCLMCMDYQLFPADVISHKWNSVIQQWYYQVQSRAAPGRPSDAPCMT